MIDSYEFGRIVVDGTEYTTDLIIFPDHVKDNWWRKEGHSLSREDIGSILSFKPEVLIVGIGASGVMKVPAETRAFVAQEGIQLIEQKTQQACKTYNDLLASSKKVVVALHLTC